MVRSGVVIALLIVLGALFGAAAPAFAHAGHKSAYSGVAATGSVKDTARDSRLAKDDDSRPAQKVNAIAFAGNGSPDPCHSQAECCSQHCSMGGVVMNQPGDTASPTRAAVVICSESRRPDDVSPETRLRPPCR